MKKNLLIALLLLPLIAVAEHMDVIEFKMLEGCPMDQYMAIVADFNKWGEDYGYQAKVAFPLQSNNLTSMYWLGTSANAAAFGKAWDAWRDAQADPDNCQQGLPSAHKTSVAAATTFSKPLLSVC